MPTIKRKRVPFKNTAENLFFQSRGYPEAMLNDSQWRNIMRRAHNQPWNWKPDLSVIKKERRWAFSHGKE